MKKKYYSLKRILDENADYNIIIGERSNGKSYACLEHIIKDYVNNKRQGAYIRRWKDDIQGKRGEGIFGAFKDSVLKLTNNEYDSIIYVRGAWHFANYDTAKRRMVADKNPFCYAFALSDMEHDKSTSYPSVCNIVYDEFLTRRYYLPDEFILYMNVLSTIIRDRDNVKIFMLGNTVNKYCPYFEEMGLKKIDDMEQGHIDVYNFANSLKIAVEYCSESPAKKSNKYFAFDNPRLNMITKGKWEMAIYPHLPQGYKIKADSVIFSFSILFNNKKIGCDVVNQGTDIFLFCRPRTSDIREGEIVYTMDYAPYMNVRKSFLFPIDKLDTKIKSFFGCNRVFYQSNEIGEIVHNYLLACVKDKL